MAKNTKAKLAMALGTLLRKKPLSRITVSELTDYCSLNRMTFYYHFSDIYELVDWSLRYVIESRIQANKTHEMSREESMLCIFQEMAKDTDAILNIYHSVSLDQLERLLYNATYSQVEQRVNAAAEKIKIGDRDRLFIIDFYNYAFIGVIIKWLKRNMKDEPEEIVYHLYRMIDGVFELSVENLSEK